MIRVLDLETFESCEPAQTYIVEAGWTDVGGNTYSGYEIAWTDDDFSGRLPYKSGLIDPGRPIPPESMAVHHITDDEAKEGSKAETVIGEAFFVPSDSIFVAHYADHEIKALGGPQGFRWVDTWKVAVHLAPMAPGWSLRVLQYWLDLDVDRRFALPAHRAGPDAYVCAALLLRMLGKLSVDEMIEISSRPAFLPRLGFGKYAKIPVQDIPAGYLDWILKQRTADGGFEFDRNVVYTAQQELMQRQKG